MIPKSGDVDVQVAPRLAVASIASTAREELGRYPERERGEREGERGEGERREGLTCYNISSNDSYSRESRGTGSHSLLQLRERYSQRSLPFTYTHTHNTQWMTITSSACTDQLL